MNKAKRYFLAVVFALIFHSQVFAANPWKITAYCACLKCCGKTDAITASGLKVRYGYVACNWLPFGTHLYIQGLGYFTVQDRGARSQFGSKKNHIRHLDVYLPLHSEALRFGVKYLDVTIIK